MDDLLEALNAPCGDCGGGIQVTFCGTWMAYLCVKCRDARGAAEMRVRLTVKDLLKEDAVYPSQAALDAAYLEAAADAGKRGEEEGAAP